MRVTQPFRTTEGDEYLVLIESFTKSTLPDDIITELEDIDIANIVLERVSGECVTGPRILFDISNYIAGFLLDNEKTILYFYCDDMNDILRRNQCITPQKYRSDLFSKMFDRYTSIHSMENLIDTPLKFETDRDIYIHLIAKDTLLPHVNTIKEALIGMSTK